MTQIPSYLLSSGYKIPVIALGVYQTPPAITSDIVYKALKLGYRHFDSAAAYNNERETAQAIAKFVSEGVPRDEIFYTTKIKESNLGYEQTKAAIAKSLDAAQSIGYIDLLLLHSPRTSKENRLGSWRALQEAVSTGKVKSIGVSNYGIHHLEELLQWEGLTIKPAVNQVELHPWLPRPELVEFGARHGIFAEAYSPLVRAKRHDEKILAELAAKYDRSVSQILIRWSLQKGFITLPKTANEARAKENLAVFDFELSDADVDYLTQDSYSPVSWDPTVYE